MFEVAHIKRTMVILPNWSQLKLHKRVAKLLYQGQNDHALKDRSYV
jgi:hypothetical protein